MFDLNPQQLAAVRHVDGPLLVLAGAGSGKTRVITERAVFMIRERGLSAANILCVTFTNKAAREMTERITHRLKAGGGAPTAKLKTTRKKNDASKGLTICTFHALGANLLRQHIDRLGYRKPFTIMPSADQVAIVRTALRELYPGVQLPVKPEAVQSAISSAKNNATTPDQDTPAGDLAHKIFDRYQRLLRACNAVDFDDLLLLPNRLLAENRDVRERVQDRYRYVQVDEFQDTNTLQMQLLEHIARAHGNLCVVGDDDQAIYGWRGAQVKNILQFDRMFGAARTRVIKLEQNYRSTQTILSAANAVIANNPLRHGKTLWSANADGEPVRLILADDEETEVQAVIDRIQLAIGRGAVLSSNAILFRTNTMTRPFEEGLRKAKLPYVLIGGQRYFDRKEVRDALAYLRLITNAADDVAFLRVVNYPSRGCGDTTVDRFTTHAAHAKLPLGVALERTANDMHDVQALTEAGRKGLIHFRDLMRDMRKRCQSIAPANLGALIRDLFIRLNLEEELLREHREADDAARRVQNMFQIADSLEGFATREAQPDANALHVMADYLERVALIDDQDSMDKAKQLKRDAIVMITIHSCKGLEFPHVHIVGFEDGTLPHKKSEAESTTGADEERRLCYVAMTRAKETLTLTMSRTRNKFGKKVETKPSRFLDEIPKELFDTAAARSVRIEHAKVGLAQVSALLEGRASGSQQDFDDDADIASGGSGILPASS